MSDLRLRFFVQNSRKKETLHKWHCLMCGAWSKTTDIQTLIHTIGCEIQRRKNELECSKRASAG